LRVRLTQHPHRSLHTIHTNCAERWRQGRFDDSRVQHSHSRPHVAVGDRDEARPQQVQQLADGHIRQTLALTEPPHQAYECLQTDLDRF
jgi:hypothetical protein